MRSIRTLLARGAQQFEADCEAWELPRRNAWGIALLPIAIVGIVTFVAVLAFLSKSTFRPLFRLLTGEDALLEWLQFVSIFAASVLSARLGIQLMRTGQRGMGVFYLLLAAGAFFVAGEEISWGQRIFGWSTPEALEAINHQNETNVHNIRWVQRAFGFVVLGGGLYGTIVPLGRALLRRERSHSAIEFLLIPPLCLVPAFLMPFGYRFFRLVFWPGKEGLIVRFGEGPELCLYLGIFLFVWLNLHRLRERNPAPVVRMSAG
jgi:hypothetical protein